MLKDLTIYSTFSIKQQVLYKKILDGLMRHDEYVICGEKEFTQEEIFDIFTAILLDNSNLFFVKNAIEAELTGWGLTKIYFTYYCDKQETERLQDNLKNCCKNLMRSANKQTKAEEDIIKLLHDKLILKTEPIIDTGINSLGKSQVIEVLLDNVLTSLNAAFAYKYLLDLNGIKSTIIMGSYIDDKGNSVIRNWNSVNFYGEERQVDVFQDAVNSQTDKICYDYFALTDEQMKMNHVLAQESGLLEMHPKMEKQNIQLEGVKKKNEYNLFSVNTFGDLELGQIVNLLVNVNKKELPKELEDKIELLTLKIDNIYSVSSNYQDARSQIEENLVINLQNLLRVLQEFYRYQKYVASPDMTELLQTRINNIIDKLLETARYNLQIFWSKQTKSMLDGMDSMQHNLIKAKRNRNDCPIDIGKLDASCKLDEFIEVFNYLKIYGINEKLYEQVVLIVEGLNALKLATENFTAAQSYLDALKNIYLPEAIELIFKYTEYEDKEMPETNLKDILDKIQNALISVNGEIKDNLEHIYKITTIDTKAQAYALADVIGRNGGRK